MKKLILLLTLTMMFGQTKLETRVYEIELNLINGVPQEFSLNDITNSLLGNNINAILYPIDFITSEISDQYSAISILHMRPDGGFDESLLGRLYSYGNYPFFKDRAQQMYRGDSSTYIEATYEDAFGTLVVAITAEFPIEDTGYIEDGFDYCVEPGANLMSYPCDSDVALLDAIPSDALSQFSGIIGQGTAATNLNGTWVGSIINLSPGSGYWIKSNSALCFNYDCSEN